MLRIVLTGPESSGKTTLALQLAAHYRVPWVPEYARVYLKKIKRDYQQVDLLEIARGQLYREERIGAGHPPLIFCDTDLLTIKIWSDLKYGNTDPWILEQIKNTNDSYYLLCGVEIPWEYDPQREHPEQRPALYEIYQKELILAQNPYTKVFGDQNQRLQQATKAIDDLLSR